MKAGTGGTMDAVAFSGEDAGVFADGTFGHSHARNRLAELVEAVDGGMCNSDAQDLMESLGGPMPDDAWDEDEALDMLNTATTEGFEWTFHDGDLMLSAEGWGSWDLPGANG